MTIETGSFMSQLEKNRGFNDKATQKIPNIETAGESQNYEMLLTTETESLTESGMALRTKQSESTGHGLDDQPASIVNEKSLDDDSNSEGLEWRNSYHLALMVLPNLLNLTKLFRNIRHPFYEWIHTSHRQYPLDGNRGIHVVEHKFMERLLTVDIIKSDEISSGILPRLKQLFSLDFYYGHCQYFPMTFKLIDRAYVNGKGFDIEGHAKNTLTERGLSK